MRSPKSVGIANFIVKLLKIKTVDTLSYKTVSLNAATVDKKWVVIDATDLVLGRLASRVALVLRGKTKAGYIPELSYGSHIFQDLVEAGILYTAVFEGNHTIAYHPEILESDPERIRDITEEITKPAEEHAGILRVFGCSASEMTLYYDLTEERLLVTL